jgi:hypothetical protein
MATFTVTKTVQYIYTIDAKSHGDAEKIAAFLTPDEADQWTILELCAESDADYAASIGGAI